MNRAGSYRRVAIRPPTSTAPSSQPKILWHPVSLAHDKGNRPSPHPRTNDFCTAETQRWQQRVVADIDLADFERASRHVTVIGNVCPSGSIYVTEDFFTAGVTGHR